VNEGIVYILTNSAMPRMVKIGKTGGDLSERLRQLYSTGVPLPFECAYAAKVSDMDKWEKAFHIAFDSYRVNPKREFFDIEPEQAIAVLELVAGENMTSRIQEEANKVDPQTKSLAEKLKRRRRPNADFVDMGIPVGSKLEFIGDGNYSCTVLDNRHVDYDGESYMVTPLTEKLLGCSARGIDCWSFDGRDLKDIYEETYESD